MRNRTFELDHGFYNDFFTDLGDAFHTVSTDINQVSAGVNGLLNPTGAASGASTTGAGGVGIPLSVGLSPATTTTLNSVETAVLVLAGVLLLLFLFMAFN